MRPAFLRQQLLIDRHVQGALMRRTALYSAACGVYFLVILVLTETMSNANTTLGEAFLRCLDEAVYWAPGLILLAPLVAYDMLKMTNRFAGPMFRLRREMQRLVEQKSASPLTFREGDHWTELTVIFNQLRDEMGELRKFKRDTEAARRAAAQAATSGTTFKNKATAKADDILASIDH